MVEYLLELLEFCEERVSRHTMGNIIRWGTADTPEKLFFNYACLKFIQSIISHIIIICNDFFVYV